MLVAGILVGCTAFPRDTPNSTDVRGGASVALQNDDRISYALVDLTGSVLPAANAATSSRRPSFGALSGGRSGTFANVRISVGDILSITIFEAAAGGLFIPTEAGSRSGNFVQVPNQQVDGTGTIEVPYAGSIKAAGRSAREVSEEIRRNLANRAIEPQVVVTINERRGNDISVLGEVNTPSRFAMDPGGIRLMGAVARAGGPRYPTYETMVSIQRAGKTHKAMLSTILKNPGQDVQLQSGDVVFLSRDPQYFMIFGATPDPSGANSRRVTFENDDMSLAEGLAKAGGLRTERADPQSVFIFRMEARRTLTQLGVDIAPYTTDVVPTVYAVNLRTADGIFLSDHFKLRDRDIIIAADAQTVDLGKFLSLVNQVAVVPYNVGVIATR
ncbi:polysaccharide biosynthesis/export family protein [Bosea lathyri]|jgi:polysaccharide export outer membrane protein|uniref:Polysaccharide export outer membrane protein n=1 Tax=Bosea lathyri TaxID=1036778 RepID=A0A1H6BGE7_9HYPH|nr:polysaccharide biosynthesis/export family protein [Bosea lathyri]SEG59730.1 polysaccharide export outer membrane protein [Bosea lathyri]